MRVPARGREGERPLIGPVVAVLLLLLVLVLIPLRLARTVRRSLRDPEFRGLFVLVIVTFAAGTLFYWQIEGWSPLNAFYFCAITLTTVGYGDLSPQTDAGKLFTVVLPLYRHRPDRRVPQRRRPYRHRATR